MSHSKVKAYKRGMYLEVMKQIRAKQVVTRSLVIDMYIKLGKSTSAAIASATVLLSPRKEDSKRGKFGNCLGNFSADGINYYMIPLNHKKGEEKKFRFHPCTSEEIATRTDIDKKRGGRKPVKKVTKVTKKVKKTKKEKVVSSNVVEQKKVVVETPVIPVVPEMAEIH